MNTLFQKVLQGLKIKAIIQVGHTSQHIGEVTNLFTPMIYIHIHTKSNTEKLHVTASWNVILCSLLCVYQCF
jgi:hypothetical protein